MQINISGKAALYLTAIAAACATPSLVHAASFDFDVTFESTDQSIWDTGDSFNLTDTTFLGVNWNESGGLSPVTLVPGVPSVCIVPNPFGGCAVRSPAVPPVTTPSVDASTNGTLGFENTFNITGGEVDATIPIDLSFSAPDVVNPGETFSLGSSFAFDPAATFNTIGPSVSESLDLIFDVATDLSFGSFNTGFDVDEQLNLFALDSDNPLPTLEASFFSLTLGVPDVNTAGAPTGANTLASSGESTFAEGDVNITNIVTTLLGLPPLNGGESFGFGPVEVGFDYNLFTALGTLDLALVQDFLLTGNLPGLVSVNGAAPVAFTVGTPIDLVAPDDASGSLDITATLDFAALFSNSTGLRFAPGFDVSALSGGLTIPGLPDPSFGPLVSIDESFPINPPIPLYDETFGLGGFNSQTVAFAVDVANAPEPPNPPGGGGGGEEPASVPEPGVLFGLAAVVLGGVFARKGRQDNCQSV